MRRFWLALNLQVAVRETDVSIKPGVERSETRGTSRRKYREPAEQAKAQEPAARFAGFAIALIRYLGLTPHRLYANACSAG
jgi:hypothetical protein